MKLLLALILIFLININLYSYQFSKILPQNTMFYLSLENSKSFNTHLNNLPEESFYKSKEFKKIKNQLKRIISIFIYEDEKSIKKTDILLTNLSKITSNSFALTVALDKFLKPQLSLFIEGKNLNKPFEELYRVLLEKEIKSGEIIFKKNIFKGVKIDVMEFKRIDKKTVKSDKSKSNINFKLVYATVGDNLIITTSVDYMELLILSITNKKSPKLSEDLIFKKDKVKYKDSDFYVFLNMRTLIKLSAFDKEIKDVLDNLSLKTLDSIIFYSKFDDKIKWYKGFMRLTSRSLPNIFKMFLLQKANIFIPKFIPDNCYDFNAFHFEFSSIPHIIEKISDKKDFKRMRDLEKNIGISIKDLFSSIGNDFYYLNFFNNKKGSFAFVLSFTKPSFVINLLRVFGSNPAIGLNEKEYLDGNIFTATGNFNLLGYAIGYKNNYFIIGNIGIVKEMMQKMGGKSGSFYNTALYKKILLFNKKKQNILSLTDTATSFYASIKEIKKDFTKTYGEASTKKQMKAIKIFKEIVDSLDQISLEKFKKYFSYSLLKFYIDKGELVLEFSEVK